MFGKGARACAMPRKEVPWLPPCLNTAPGLHAPLYNQRP